MVIFGRVNALTDIIPDSLSPDPNWAELEFGRLDLGDARRTRRLTKAFQQMIENPGLSVPELSDSWADTKSFYRLLDQELLTDQSILDAHRQGAIRRAAQSREHILLAVQDTTTINLTGREKLEGKGAIGDGKKGSGLHLHNTLLIGAQSGNIFGLLGAKLYARETLTRKERGLLSRKDQPIEDKESFRWIESFRLAKEAHQELAASAPDPQSAPRIISVGDREADIFELLLEAGKHAGQGIELLVRSQFNREIDDPEQERLWAALAAAEEQGRLTVSVPRDRSIQQREVSMSVRFQQVRIEAPEYLQKQKAGQATPIGLTAIEVREVDVAPEDGICWRLLTTLKIDDVGAAIDAARWYAKRWQIEVMHRVFKSGCKVERRQMRTMDRLRPMIAMDLVVACYIMSLVHAARTQPDALASAWLEPDELEALCRYHKLEGQKTALLTIGRGVPLIAKLGGHLGRKGDGPPGAEVIWRGVRKLQNITDAWLVFSEAKNVGKA